MIRNKDEKTDYRKMIKTFSAIAITAVITKIITMIFNSDSFEVILNYFANTVSIYFQIILTSVVGAIYNRK